MSGSEHAVGQGLSPETELVLVGGAAGEAFR